MPRSIVHPQSHTDGSAVLRPYQKNVTSQGGQDGVIERIFEVIGVKNRWCIEFGAWDGKHLSNTWNLINNHGWSAVLIEADKERFQELQDRYAGNAKVHGLNQYVGFLDGKDSLDTLLEQTNCPRDVDFVSIDIDGNDWHIWKSLERYRPRALVIEYNPTAGPDVYFVQDRDFGINQGSSLRALVQLGKEKGYELVSADHDAYFVRAEDFPLFGIADNDVSQMFTPHAETLFGQGFDGSVVLAGNRNLIWQGAKLESDDVQVLPESMRKLWWQDDPVENTAETGTPAKNAKAPHDETALRLSRAVNLDLLEWGLAGSPVPPPLILKQAALCAYIRSSGYGRFVETGTYLAETARVVARLGVRIDTIELSRELHERAVEVLRPWPKVRLHCGDSGSLLANILDQLDEPAVFWLDAHYSGGNTALGERATAIVEELEALKQHRIREHIVIVDDMRGFGSGHYPTEAWVRAIGQEIVPASTPVLRNDSFIFASAEQHEAAARVAREASSHVLGEAF